MTPIQKCDQAVMDTALAIAKVKFEWVDAQMERIMPPEMYALSKFDKGSTRFKLARWLSSNHVKIVDVPTDTNKPEMAEGKIVTRIMRGQDVLSEFTARLKDGKFETMSRDFPI